MTTVVAATHAYSSGNTSGMNSTASMTSLPRVLMVMVDSNVPIPATPMVPTSNGTTMSRKLPAGCVPVRKK